MITNLLYDLLPILWTAVGVLAINKLAESECFEKYFGK